MKRLLKLAGLNQELTPHSLRHTHTSLLAEAGISLEQIMHQLSHSSDRITTKCISISRNQKEKRLLKSSEN